MTMALWVVAVAASAGTALWITIHLRAATALMRLPSLSTARPEGLKSWPKLSLIVTACDEEATIGRAAETLLRQDYPDLEIILIDDRSRDGTRAAIDALAARDDRVRAVHIDALPAGWLGKVHALHRGTQAASGEWLLFCDADVHLAPDCLRRAVALAVERGLDHMPVMPQMPADGLLLEATYCAFGLAYLATLRAGKLADPSSDAYAGVGAFNLVRAEVLARAGGLPELKMEVADDVGIGYLAKRAGGRAGLALGGGAIEVAWYASVGDMARGLEKNLFGVIGHYRLGRAVVRTAGGAVLAASPFAAAALPITGAWIAAAAAVPVLAVFAWVVRRRLGQRSLAGFLSSVGIPILCYMTARSIVATLKRGGIVWRGTFYPLAELRAGQRVKV